MPDAFVQLKSCGWADVKKKNVSLSQNKSRDARRHTRAEPQLEKQRIW